MHKSVIALLCGAASFFSAHCASAAEGSDFYRGKTISLVVNYTTGGPTDTEARILARHLIKHIPGEPAIIVRNMAGAGGMIGVNWLGQVAPPDGLTIGYLTALAGAAVQDTSSLKIDPNAIPFIAGVESLAVYYARTDTQGGLSKPVDLMTKSGFWVGGLTPDSAKDIKLRAELDLLGLSYKYISGYAGAAEARLALERNEVQLTAESLPTYRVSIEPALVDTGKAIALWYDAASKNIENGDPDAAGIKALPFERFYREVKGEPPKSELWSMSVLMGELATRFLRTIHVPPNTPRESIAVLRQAFGELDSDPEYRADAVKTITYVPRFSVGPDAGRAFHDSVAIDPGMKSFIRDYVAKGYAMVGK